MKVALVNPPWRYDGSIYFGCRAPHLPIELGCAAQLLAAAGHEATILDAHLLGLSLAELADRVRAAAPDMVVITTAPTYLFWRCAPPELRVPQETARALRDLAPLLVAVGPHGSTTPRAALKKLDVDVVVMGESEETLVRLAAGERDGVPGLCYVDAGTVRVSGGPQAACFVDMAPLAWPDEFVARHRHHHHRFDAEPAGPGAEVEASRGCPYSCTFCAKENFRNGYRRRPPASVLAEIDALQRQGVEYVYFIDEIFLPNAELLEGLVGRGLTFGVQTRIDLWKPDQLALLGRAGCGSVEAGVESLSVEGRDALAKKCRLSTDELAERLYAAKRHIPFVQANLIEMPQDDDETVQRWRDAMRAAGVWANDPVPLFPYPGSPDYRRLWGEPDDEAWERAHAWYLGQFAGFSDIQEERPRPLPELERECCA
ncbi:TIGR04295 family B12-binding domain-containing radical SAM protein [Rhodoplanes sp. TEM]|uniref:TIGR04295 family B12-binding domain-containing radical SAM protein n=1 Tax=Rhodoplanes tepidamans TaxID=200616 RepID=A0ABT5J777_RHOTP|nr:MULTISPECIES: TIGR04295 family B12-binding domain-containing radical SAM protein [Rhodoplanes]MDC7785487.1 TIGR04295 family B12-binding domain-containing radical SAM protein [Rhodoplanes tepidamans]MDC7987334.1 TIGR04295 family B12-binding domain-containing radical SAM protein [Rhodoplanes sp. TEM]MDQ0353343.1 B12-binding domain/radical SAM domain protein of rhizo-twelve system [Rhodoplanes tepidamans]